MTGQTNAVYLKTIQPVGDRWEDIKTMTLNNPSSAPLSYEITIPPAMVDLSTLFTPSNLRGCDITVHKTGGSAITSLNQAFRYPTSDRTITLDFDTSAVTNWDRCFSRAGLGSAAIAHTIIGVLDFTAATSSVGSAFSDILYNAAKISSFRIAEGSLSQSMNFYGVNPDSDTLASIVSGLKDMTGQTAPTLTLISDVKARLTAEQTATIAAKNWVLA